MKLSNNNLVLLFRPYIDLVVSYNQGRRQCVWL